MKYGKKATSKKRNSLTSRSSMLGNKAHVSLLRVMLFLLITILVAGASLGVGAIKSVIENAPDADAIDIMPLGYASFLYDDQGNQLRKLAAPSSNRLPVSILCVHAQVNVIQTSGLPHSDTRGSSDIGSYPRLFAANHVLLRLAAPRHPPWTLIRLTILFISSLR